MPDAYAALKIVHVASAAASIGLFALRGGWMMTAPERLQRRWVRIVPHVIDTVLLASAIALTVMLDDLTANGGWLGAKVAALVAYIILGTIALKRGRTQGVRIAAFAAALVVFAYIVSVALSKSAAGFLAFLSP
jgi:uncharacterized membrane protein SirB2